MLQEVMDFLDHVCVDASCLGAGLGAGQIMSICLPYRTGQIDDASYTAGYSGA